MPDFTPVAQPVIKISLIINGGSNGFSENYYFHSNSSVNFFQYAEYAAQRLAAIRSNGMANGAAGPTYPSPTPFTIVGFRLATTDGSNLSYSRPVKPTTLTPVNGPAADFTAGLLVQLRNSTGLIKRPLLLRGIPAAWDFNDGRMRPQTNPSPALVQFINSFGNYLSSVNENNVEYGYFCIRTEDKAAPGQENQTINNVILHPTTGTVGYVTDGPMTLSPQSGKIHISGVKGRCAKGLNGEAKIVEIVPDDPDWVVYTNKKWCCPSPPEVYPGGKLRNVVHAYAQIAPASSTTGMPGIGLQRGGQRQMGGSFFGTRGRARKKCC